MTETPLLRFDGPALVFGGPYSNLQATAAVLAEAERFGIPPDRIICTGDIVAYCGDPNATIELVRRSRIHAVMGNCDEQLARDALDCGCGFPSGSSCERLSSAWFAFANGQVGRELRAWLASLPRRIDVRIGAANLAVIHGGVSQINHFVFASTAAAIKRRELGLAGGDGVIGGHCGLPFSQVIDGRLGTMRVSSAFRRTMEHRGSGTVCSCRSRTACGSTIALSRTTTTLRRLRWSVPDCRPITAMRL